MEGGRRRRRLFSVMFTFLMSLSMDMELELLGDILNSSHNNNQQHLTVFSLNNVRTFSRTFVGALELNNKLDISDNNLYKINNNEKKKPLVSSLQETESQLSHPQEKQDENDSIEISRTVEPLVLQRLESKFLKLFGMTKRPPKDKKLVVPKYLLDIYKKQTGEEEEAMIQTTNLNLPGRNTRTANTVRTFYPGSSLEQDPNHLSFTLDNLPPEEQVTGAELRIPFTLEKNEENKVSVSEQVTLVKILLHDIIKPKTPKNSKKPKQFHLTQPITQPIDSKTVNLSKRRNGTSEFWLTFDAFPAVSRWASGGPNKVNHGLLIEVIGFGKEGRRQIYRNIKNLEIDGKHKLRVKRDVDESSKEEEVGAAKPVIERSKAKQIVLFTYSDDGRSGRKTRDAKTLSRQYRAAQQQHQRRRKGQRNKNRKRNLCARHKMFVDFTDVGWNDWIVAPPGYEAYHCSGECPFPMAEHLNATNHAVIQALVNSMNPGLVPPPCCVPNKYSALTLLYTDSTEKIVMKNYQEMVVDSCSCA